MLTHDVVLKNNELFLVGKTQPTMKIPERGLYARDTRFLSRLELSLNDGPRVEFAVADAGLDRATLTSLDTPTPITADIVLTDQLTVTLTVADAPETTLHLTIGTDFLDMFQVRGMNATSSATLQEPKIANGSATLQAISSDTQEVGVRIEPDSGWNLSSSLENGTALVRLTRTVSAGESLTSTIAILPQPVGKPLTSAATSHIPDAFQPRLTIADDASAWSTFLRQSDADLALLFTSFPDGDISAAGIPWYIAPFGRDSLITALQTMEIYPERSASTLRVLARLQGAGYDAFREEQPGKILHEMRYGDMARSGQVPHAPYYGSIDATSLFVMTFAKHVLLHRDEALFRDLLPHVLRAISWMQTDGDQDGDGFIEFGAIQTDDAHISQQGWKDSGDSLHFADGREVTGPVALVEVQGYAYAAYAWLADALREFGDAAQADEFASRAEELRLKIEADFWMEDAGTYCQALDGTKAQVDAISSNPGHLLYCGVPSDERAARMIERMFAEDMNGGWGTRTLSNQMATYDPESYHNGSVWPHDVSVFMAGCVRYGCTERAQELLDQITALASYTDRWRISELYCGYPREADTPPVVYAETCTPQAWAAGSALLGYSLLHSPKDE